MKRLHLVTWIAVGLAVCVYGVDRAPSTIPAGKGQVLDSSWMTDVAKPLAPAEWIRPGDQTFLTFPEWYLVFGPAEQADSSGTTPRRVFPSWCRSINCGRATGPRTSRSARTTRSTAAIT